MMIENRFFPEIRGNFGFGCMRLPMKGGKIDYNEFTKMVDAFIDAGFNYFDTAHGYHNGESEVAIREYVSKRYDRDMFLLANKLTDPYFNKQEDIRPFFENQLDWCGVEYFDFYLMHAQDVNNYKKFQRCKAYETCSELKKEGKIGHLGISFHDKADVLDMILTDHPEIEFVQIQFNYVDYEDASVESRKVYEVCVKHGKPVLVMEPIKGGNLVNLPKEADDVFRSLNGGSNASYALRYAASKDNMCVVLSGMSNMDHAMDNIGSMKDFRPLTDEEYDAVQKVCDIFKKMGLIPCTACRYCIEENQCPKNIRIPDMFSALNTYTTFNDWNSQYYYNHSIIADGHGKASECIGCKKCEKVCPQHLKITELLEEVVNKLEDSA